MSNHIKVRTINGVTSFYTAQDGVVLKSISSIRFADVENAVFSLVKKDGEYYTYPPQRNMQLVKLADAIEKDYILFKVS